MPSKINYIILCDSLDAYHNALFGEPLALHGEPRAVVEETLQVVQSYVAILGKTFGGREVLRNLGWAIPEVEPALQEIADYNDFEYDRSPSIKEATQ
jgi:hypothetical protein